MICRNALILQLYFEVFEDIVASRISFEEGKDADGSGSYALGG